MRPPRSDVSNTTRGARSAFSCAVVFSIACVWTASVSAQRRVVTEKASATSQDYQTIIAQGVSAYQDGRYPEAHELFRQAHMLEPNARTLRGLGIVEQKLGHYARSIQLLERALAEQRTPLTELQRADASQLIQTMRPLVGVYRVTLKPAEAIIVVDGKEVAMVADTPLVLDAGLHKVVVSAPGYASRTRQVQVSGNEAGELRFSLEPLGLVESRLATPASSTDTDLGTRSGAAWRSTAAWIAVGAASVALTGGIVAWSAREEAAALWNSDDCLDPSGPRSVNCQDEREDVESAETLMAVGLVSSAVFGAVAAWLFLSAPSESEQAPTSTRCGAGPGALGLACGMHF
jgi:tetratricopeptide (TPR) repeat protein